MRLACSVFVLTLVALAFARAQAKADAAATLEKAIKAHGGDAKVKRPAYALKVKGILIRDGKTSAYSGSIQAQGPDRARIELKTDSLEWLTVLNGDKGWNRTGGETGALTKEELEDAREDCHTDWVATLVPLRGKDFVLTVLDAAKIGDRAVVGFRVSHKGRRAVDLYFDSETWLLVKKRFTRLDDDGKELEFATVFEQFRDFDGIKFPTKSTTFRDGQKRFVTEVVEARFVERLPEATFSKP